MRLPAAAHTRVDIVADVDDIAAAGPALALWTAVRAGDRPAGHAVFGVHSPAEVAVSAVPLLIHLLQQAGHHHRFAHTEVLHQLVRPEVDPLSVPRLDLGCPPNSHDEAPLDPDLHECLCDVETACTGLAPSLSRHPTVSDLHAQVLATFRDDRHVRDLPLVGVTVVGLVAFTEAAALLVARRYGVDVDAVHADAQSTVTKAVRAAMIAGR